MTTFSGQRVTVMGLGRFGGGLGVTRWLAGLGAEVRVTDITPADRLAEPLEALRPLIDDGRVTVGAGGHDERDFTTCDLVVVNPAVPRPWDDPFLGAARAAGVPLTTEIRLLTERVNRRRVIGVTGTAGKSTTTAMIHHVLGSHGVPSIAGGNLGGSLLSNLDELGPETWVVLELSSAMLHWLDRGAGHEAAPGWSPHVAVFTNLAENHLDWHGSFAHYRASKQVIFDHQEGGDHALRGEDDASPDTHLPLAVPGRHNQANARLAARAVAHGTGIDERAALETLGGFGGLPHRLQLVVDRGGLSFFNDSKSTTPAATRLAVESFERPNSVHLIAGGYDKQIDLKPIADLAGHLAGLYTIGATGRAIAEQARPAAHADYSGTLEQAVTRAAQRMQPGDVLLLSPGCASWDQFDNFEQRGEAFAALVKRKVVGQTPPAYPYPNRSRSSSSSPK